MGADTKAGEPGGLDAAVIKFAGAQMAMASALEAIATNIGEQNGLMREAGRRFKRERLVAAVVFTAQMVMIVMLLANSFTNRATLDIVRSVTDPEGKSYQEGQRRQADLLLGFALEMDCRGRRALKGQPAPIIPLLPGGAVDYANPMRTCIAQTEPAVFPGAGD